MFIYQEKILKYVLHNNNTAIMMMLRSDMSKPRSKLQITKLQDARFQGACVRAHVRVCLGYDPAAGPCCCLWTGVYKLLEVCDTLHSVYL